MGLADRMNNKMEFHDDLVKCVDGIQELSGIFNMLLEQYRAVMAGDKVDTEPRELSPFEASIFLDWYEMKKAEKEHLYRYHLNKMVEYTPSGFTVVIETTKDEE